LQTFHPAKAANWAKAVGAGLAINLIGTNPTLNKDIKPANKNTGKAKALRKEAGNIKGLTISGQKLKRPKLPFGVFGNSGQMLKSGIENCG